MEEVDSEGVVASEGVDVGDGGVGGGVLGTQQLGLPVELQGLLILPATHSQNRALNQHDTATPHPTFGSGVCTVAAADFAILFTDEIGFKISV